MQTQNHGTDLEGGRTEAKTSNHAHAINYRVIFDKMLQLADEKSRFKDESETLYLGELKNTRLSVSSSVAYLVVTAISSNVSFELPVSFARTRSE